MIDVQPATPRTVDAAARVLASAFTSDPVVTRFVPAGERDPRAWLTMLFKASILRAGLSNVDVAVHRDARTGNHVVGASVWESPVTTSRLVDRVWGSLRAAWQLRISGLRVLAEYEAAVHQVRPKRPHWRLEDIGSAPEARGMGVGKALLQHRLAHIDHCGDAAFLEATTPSSQRLYEKFGFRPHHQLATGVAAGAMTMIRTPVA